MTIDIEKLAKEHCHYQQSADQFSITLYGLKQFSEAYAAKVHDKRVGELESKNRELSASINDLREALEKIAETNASTHGLTTTMVSFCIKTAKEALSKTPAQSMQEHDGASHE